ncbi:hypothetical protein B0H17DRAFT_955713, partial [Mycena rosella]
MEDHTVFEAEVTGAILALNIIKLTLRVTSYIFMDCQPAIAAIVSPKVQPGLYLLALFRTASRQLQHACSTLCIRIHWVPAPIGIAGNEEVNAHAKDAARGHSTPLHPLICALESPLPTSRTAAI